MPKSERKKAYDREYYQRPGPKAKKAAYMKEWNLRHLQERKEKDRIYYQEHRGPRDLQSRKWKQEHPDKAREWAHEWQVRNPEKAKSQNKERRGRRGENVSSWAKDIAGRCRRMAATNPRKPCEITADDILDLWKLQDGKCAITKQPMLLTREKHHPHKPSLDRIDSSLGYIKGNVRIVWLFCQNAKYVWTDAMLNECCTSVINGLSGQS